MKFNLKFDFAEAIRHLSIAIACFSALGILVCIDAESYVGMGIFALIICAAVFVSFGIYSED